MRRALALLLALPALAACGAGETAGGGPTSSGPVEEPPVSSEPVEEDQLPPQVVLLSRAGRQVGVQGSYCVTGPSTGTCADYVESGPPEELSVVRPGESVELVVETAQAAEGSASARVLWCEQEIATVPLTGPSTPWTVDLKPGSYELEVFATFEAGATSGDTSVSLGLLVERRAPLAIVPRPDSIVGCPIE
jgi:hypothetical protein